ncbi:MAG TPA: flavin reductase family protein [Anaerolineae bacterium]|nr:flavin reductase family protein [Anaerolineae bacterium]
MKREVSLGRAHRLLASRPACLLTTRYKGQVNVMTLVWTCPISMEPPLVAMAIHPSRYSCDMLKRSEECVLNIPGRPLAEQVLKCGSLSGEDVDKIQLTGLTPESGHRVDSPWIDECLAHLECVVLDILTPGDHVLFITEIVGAWAEEEAFCESWLVPQDNEALLPLHHLGGKSFCLMGKTIEAP